MTGTGSDLSVTPTASSLTGSGDTTALEVSGVTAGTFTVSGATETVSVKSSGSATNTLTNVVAASAANLVISGSATFKTTGNIGANFTLVDARSASAVDIDLVSSATQTVLLGSGNDTLELNTALAAGNLISMGAGTDTLELVVSTGGAAATLTGVENIKTLDAATTSIALTNADSAIAVEVAAAATGLSVTNMRAGSSIKATEALNDTNGGTISFADSQAATKLNLDLQKGDAGAGGALTFTNVEDLTITTGAATAFASVALDETAATTVVTKSLTLTNTGSGAVGTGNLTQGDKVETFTINNSGTGAVTVGTYIDIEKLKTLTINATAGAVTTGAFGGTTASTDLNAVTVNAGANVTLGAIGSADTAGVATVTLAATGGTISADGTVNGTLTGGAGTITNTGGNITSVSISGSKDIEAGIVAAGGSSRVATVTSTATGSVYLTVTNAATSGAGSTITLGNAGSGKVNQLTLGSGANDNVTGGSGDDTFILTSDGSDTIDGGAGTDTLSFAGNTNGQIISIDSSTNYLNSKTAANAGAADIVSGGRVYDNNSGSVNTTSSGYTMAISNIENIVGSSAADIVYGNSSANSVTGGDGNDTINAGGGNDTVTGGDGNDTIDLGSSADLDTVVFTGTAIASGTNNVDTVTGFASTSAAASADVLVFGSTFTGGVAFGSGQFASVASNSFLSANSANTANKILAVTGSAANYSGDAGVVTLMGSAFSNAASERAVLLLDNGTNTYIYYVDDALDTTATDISAADVVLIGILSGVTGVGANWGATNIGAAI